MKPAEEFLKIACSLLEFKEQERTFVFSIFSKKPESQPIAAAAKKGGVFSGFFGKK